MGTGDTIQMSSSYLFLCVGNCGPREAWREYLFALTAWN